MACYKQLSGCHAGTVMSYFALLYRFRNEERLLIWISGEPDTVAVNRAGDVVSFQSLAELFRYAQQMNWRIEDEKPNLHDLDAINEWILAWQTPPNCQIALEAWNLFSDIAFSTTSHTKFAFAELDSHAPALYDRLFWGNNLPAVTPQGECFVPAWSEEELKVLGALLSAGLEMFGASVKRWEDSPCNASL